MTSLHHDALFLKDIEDLERIVFEQKVTAYDAIYLHLAKKKGCKLLTLDTQLLKLKPWTVGLDIRRRSSFQTGKQSYLIDLNKNLISRI